MVFCSWPGRRPTNPSAQDPTGSPTPCDRTPRHSRDYSSWIAARKGRRGGGRTSRARPARAVPLKKQALEAWHKRLEGCAHDALVDAVVSLLKSRPEIAPELEKVVPMLSKDGSADEEEDE